MSRLDFEDIETEVTRALGNPTDTNAAARIQQWIKQKYYEYALTFHQPELDVEYTDLTLSQGEMSVELPEDVYVVFGTGLLDPGTTDFRRWLTSHDARSIQSVFNPIEAEPTGVARFGNTLRFNSASDDDYPLLIWYYRWPEEPDFTDDEDHASELGELWDDILIQGSVARGHTRFWRPDLAAAFEQQVMTLLSLVSQPPLTAVELPDRPARPLKNETFMGTQG